jgi:hypothetical protein
MESLSITKLPGGYQRGDNDLAKGDLVPVGESSEDSLVDLVGLTPRRSGSRRDHVGITSGSRRDHVGITSGLRRDARLCPSIGGR